MEVTARQLELIPEIAPEPAEHLLVQLVGVGAALRAELVRSRVRGPAIIGRGKGSSFFVWFLIGLCLPGIGLAAALLYRFERDEPRRRCPRCPVPGSRPARTTRRC